MNTYLGIKNECLSINAEEDNNDEADETKRKTRNLSEKKRRDQFNTLISELNDIVSPTNRKMDKSTVLETAINNLKSYNENVVRSKEFELDEDFKPSFITNEEYSFLMLQSIDGFLIVFSSCGKILYTSDTLTLVLGYQLEEVLNTNIYDMISQDDRTRLENLFFVSTINNQYAECEGNNPLHFNCKFVRKSDGSYEPVEFIGNIKTQEIPSSSRGRVQMSNKSFHDSLMFVGLARLLKPARCPEISLHDHVKTEFVSHHNFEWKFLFLDERAPSIIGYSPFEVLGTSGYDYYHVDDLDNICAHHKILMTQDKGISGYYRFLTKGHEWIWLQTKSYVNRRQWNSRVEFIVCTHKVVNPLMPENETEADVNRFNRPTSSSSSCTDSTTGSSMSMKRSPTSWHSTTTTATTTSESNHYDENDPLRQACEGYYPDDNSVSSSASSRELLNAYKKRKTNKKFYRQHRLARTIHTNTSDSSNQYCIQYGSNFVNTPPEIASSSDYMYKYQVPLCGMESSRSSNAMLEDSLQKKCNELQRIIANRTEELRIVSEQLYVARNANQQKYDTEYYTSLTTSIIAEENESSPIVRHFANISGLSSGETKNL